MEQQREAGTLGMWFSWLTEIMFFVQCSSLYALPNDLSAAFASASNHLDLTLGAVIQSSHS